MRPRASVKKEEKKHSRRRGKIPYDITQSRSISRKVKKKRQFNNSKRVGGGSARSRTRLSRVNNDVNYERKSDRRAPVRAGAASRDAAVH